MPPNTTVLEAAEKVGVQVCLGSLWGRERREREVWVLVCVVLVCLRASMMTGDVCMRVVHESVCLSDFGCVALGSLVPGMRGGWDGRNERRGRREAGEGDPPSSLTISKREAIIAFHSDANVHRKCLPTPYLSTTSHRTPPLPSPSSSPPPQHLPRCPASATTPPSPSPATVACAWWRSSARPSPSRPARCL